LKATALQFVKKQTCHDKENKPLLRIWSITQTYYILNQNIGLSMWQTHINKENFSHIMTLINTHLTGLETIHIMTLILTSNAILHFLTKLYYRQEEMIEK
jgi:putative heme iron utilization protein